MLDLLIRDLHGRGKLVAARPRTHREHFRVLLPDLARLARSSPDGAVALRLKIATPSKTSGLFAVSTVDNTHKSELQYCPWADSDESTSKRRWQRRPCQPF